MKTMLKNIKICDIIAALVIFISGVSLYTYMYGDVQTVAFENVYMLHTSIILLSLSMIVMNRRRGRKRKEQV